jgi:hypothetical protein
VTAILCDRSANRTSAHALRGSHSFGEPFKQNNKATAKTLPKTNLESRSGADQKDLDKDKRSAPVLQETYRTLTGSVTFRTHRNKTESMGIARSIVY